MVVPDFELICEIMLVAEGFVDARALARKFITLYSLCKELLSKQVSPGLSFQVSLKGGHCLSSEFRHLRYLDFGSHLVWLTRMSTSKVVAIVE